MTNYFRRAFPYKLHDPFGYVRFVLEKALRVNLESIGLERGSRVLDFGCGTQPYRALLPTGCEYLAADLPDNPLSDLPIVDGRVDLPDESVDLVISTQVLEHVPDPAQYLGECHRVLRVGGRLLLSTHGVMFYHPSPTDYWRWTLDGLSLAASNAKLRIESISPLVGTVPTAIWLLMMNAQWRLPWGLRHALVIVSTLAMRWTDRPAPKSRYRSEFLYVLVARRDRVGDLCA